MANRATNKTKTTNLDPFAFQVGGDHYKRFGFDPFKVCGLWPKWAGDVFTYLIRKKSEDDYAKAMHTLAMFVDMEAEPQAQPLAYELTRHWIESSYDALGPGVADCVLALAEYVSAPTPLHLQNLISCMNDLTEGVAG